MNRSLFHFSKPLITLSVISLILLTLVISSIVSVGAAPLSDKPSNLQPEAAQVTPGGAGSPAATPSPSPTASPAGSPAPSKLTASQFHDAMRKLWMDHNIWHRAVIVSIFADLPDLEAAQARQVQNQVDIGNGIKPFYGEAAGDQLADLLTQHIMLVNNVVMDLKNGDTAAAEKDQAAAYANGDDIAAFLNQANPKNWPLPTAQGLLRAHIDSILLIAQARSAATKAGADGDWEAEIAAFDRALNGALILGDVLSQGIIAQFPDQFAGEKPPATAPGATSNPSASPDGTVPPQPPVKY